MNRNFAPARSWLDRSYVQIGRFDDAITEFRGVEQSVPEWPVAIAGRRLRLDLRFDGLRADPRFSELLDRIKFLQCER